MKGDPVIKDDKGDSTNDGDDLPQMPDKNNPKSPLS
jgi:hypothetical protein